MYVSKQQNRLCLHKDPFQNIIAIDNYDFEVRYLHEDAPKRSNSPNASIFALFDPQEEAVTQVIKFCRYFRPCKHPHLQLKAKRFEREIKALGKVKKEGKNSHVIEFLADGEQTIEGKIFRFYTMEYASGNLMDFLRENDINQQQRYLICADMIKCINSLHEMGIYHRDIKPANFLIINNKLWKIADLGLIDSREEDLAASDQEGEKIGPIGFLSPEALNKWLGFSIPPPSIDDKSDVFQLARVMGLVLQQEAFAGQMAIEDFASADESEVLFELMSQSFQYSKDRRFDINQLKTTFLERFSEKYALA